jgi:hypothetical protein
MSESESCKSRASPTVNRRVCFVHHDGLYDGMLAMPDMLDSPSSPIVLGQTRKYPLGSFVRVLPYWTVATPTT